MLATNSKLSLRNVICIAQQKKVMIKFILEIREKRRARSLWKIWQSGFYYDNYADGLFRVLSCRSVVTRF